MRDCSISIYAVLGAFKRWEPASYIVEDYFRDNRGVRQSSRRARRTVYGLATDSSKYGTNDGILRSCIYGSGGGCSPFFTSVAEYALAVHKLLHTGCNVYLTFFTPLTLLRPTRQNPGARIDYDTLIGHIVELARELGERLEGGGGCSAYPWCVIARALSGASVVQPDWSPLKIVSAEATLRAEHEGICLARRLTTYMVPLPARLNQSRDNTLYIYIADILHSERMASTWITSSLRALNPQLAVLDTTHGVNYIALLVEKAFRRAAQMSPIGGSVKVQIYNTDPVIGRPSEQATYKYHLIEEYRADVSGIVRSPSLLASILYDYTSEIKNIIDLINWNKDASSALDDVAFLLERAARSFDNDVILWGFVLSELAVLKAASVREQLLREKGLDNSAWLHIYEEIENKNNIIRIKQYITIATSSRDDPLDSSMASAEAKLFLTINGLITLFKSINEVWEMMKTRLGIEKIDYAGTGGREEAELQGLEDIASIVTMFLRKTKPYSRKASTAPGLMPYMVIEYIVDTSEGDEIPSYFPAAAYILLSTELRQSIPGWVDKASKVSAVKEGDKRAGEDGGHQFDKRNFIAHGGLSRGVVVEASRIVDSRRRYRIVVDLRRLAEALNAL